MTFTAIGNIFEFLGHTIFRQSCRFFDESSYQNSTPLTADLSNKNGTKSFSNSYFADTSPDMPDLIIATNSLA
jgi:hypothetical protein